MLKVDLSVKKHSREVGQHVKRKLFAQMLMSFPLKQEDMKTGRDLLNSSSPFFN